ncbi:MAG: flippase [Halopenitus sp.]
MSDGSILTTLAKEGSISFLGKITSRVIDFLFLLLITRFVDPSIYGVYTLAITIILFVQVFSDLNMFRSVDFFLPQYLDNNEYGKSKSLIIYVTFVSLSGSLITFVLLFMAAPQIATYFGDIHLNGAIRVFSFGLVLITLNRIQNSIFRGIKNMKYKVITDDIIRRIAQITTTAVLLFFGFELYAIIGGYMTGIAFAIIIGNIIIKTNIRNIIIAQSEPISRGKVLRYSFPLVFAGAIYKLVGQIDFFVIGFLLSSSEVGLYRVGYQLTSNLAIFLASLTPIFKPLVAEKIDDSEYIQSQFEAGSRWLCILTIPPVIAIFVAPSTFLTILFTSQYSDAALPVTVLSIGFLFQSCFGITSAIIEGKGNTKLNLLNGSLFLTVNIVADIVLVSFFGIIGAALGTAISFISVNSLKIWEVNYLYDLAYPWREISKICLNGIPALIIIYLIGHNLSSHVLKFILIPILSIIMFIISLRVTNSFTQDDQRIARRVDEKIGYSIIEPIVGRNKKV